MSFSTKMYMRRCVSPLYTLCSLYPQFLIHIRGRISKTSEEPASVLANRCLAASSNKLEGRKV